MRAIWLAVILVLPASLAYGEDTFDIWFTGDTLRVDLYHSGTSEESVLSLDDVIIEGPWPGTRTKLIDDMNLGHYLFSIYDAESKEQIYSRGFSSLFGEWQTIDEAKKIRRTISESVRFPCPRKTFELAVFDRDKKGRFVEIYRVTIDPNYHTVRKEKRYAGFEVIELHVPAEPSKVYDVLILPDGYSAGELEKLHRDAQRSADILLSTKPYSEMKDKIAVRAIEAISADSGPDEPREGIWRDTVFDTSFNAFDLPRYVLTFANKTIRDVAANAPYDALLIMVNSDRYGGGGIFNLYTTYTADSEWAAYLITHEAGHSFVGLGDEYYTSKVAYNEFYPRGIEPWEPNITALLDPSNVKWSDMIVESTPIPTPEEEKYKNTVGVFEGAGYSAEGLYRPYKDCKMFSKGDLEYCPVCMAAVRRLIEFYTE